jgi:hypothetical protein
MKFRDLTILKIFSFSPLNPLKGTWKCVKWSEFKPLQGFGV